MLGARSLPTRILADDPQQPLPLIVIELLALVGVDFAGRDLPTLPHLEAQLASAQEPSTWPSSSDAVEDAHPGWRRSTAAWHLRQEGAQRSGASGIEAWRKTASASSKRPISVRRTPRLFMAFGCLASAAWR